MRKILSRMGAAVRGFGFKQWFMTALIAALLLASAASLIGLGVVRRALVSVTAAERFRGGTDVRFAQIGCFLPVGQGKTEEDIFKFRQTLDSKLVEQSLEAPENGSLYLDAYCGMGTVTAVGNNGVSASVGAIGVGGDFFFFHPLVLRSGSYIQGGDLMDDLVVLDEETAWKLFGAVDLAGMPMTINGKDFVVSGVAAREDDFATKKAYGGDSGIFMSYSALSRLLEEYGRTGHAGPHLRICTESGEGELFRGQRRHRGEQQPLCAGPSVAGHPGFREPLHADQRRDLSLLGERRPADRGLRCAADSAGGVVCVLSGVLCPGEPHPVHGEDLSVCQGQNPGEGGDGCGEAQGRAAGT